MDDRPAAAPTRSRVRTVAALTAGLLAVLATMVVSVDGSLMPTALALGATAASYAIITAMSARRDDALVGGAASGLAVSTRVVIVGAVLLGTAAPILMLLLREPFLLGPVAVVINAAAAGGGLGMLLVFGVFVLQFVLASEGRRLAPAPSEREATGYAAGWALGLAPVVLATIVGLTIAKKRTDVAMEHSRDENKAFFVEYAADSLRAARFGEEAPRRALTHLHACIHSGCVDSLLLAAKRDSIEIRYNPLPGHRYWASAQAGRGQFARRLVTDETGTLLEWPILPREMDHAAPDSTDILQFTDTTVREMSRLGDCVWYQYQLNFDHVPEHVTQVCALSGDTTKIRVSNGTVYVVAFRHIAPTRAKPAGDFELSARPEIYARTDARSFLIRREGKDVRVTTEDRAARAADPPVHDFDFGSGTLRIRTH